MSPHARRQGLSSATQLSALRHIYHQQFHLIHPAGNELLQEPTSFIAFAFTAPWAGRNR